MSCIVAKRPMRQAIQVGTSARCNPNSLPYIDRGGSKVPSGRGRRPALAGHGYRVVGLDLSSGAIEKAKKAAEPLALDVVFDTADLTSDIGYRDHFNTVIDGLVFHCLPAQIRGDYVRSLARSLKPGGRFFALVFATEAFPPNSEFGPRPFTEQQLRDVVGRHLVVDEVRRARAWVNVPGQLPEGFEYRNVTIGSDGRAQLPAWLVSAHRS